MDIAEQIKSIISKKLYTFIGFISVLFFIIALWFIANVLGFEEYQLLNELNIVKIEEREMKQEIEKGKEEKTDAETPSVPIPRIEIENVHVTPVAFDIPSSFYAEITNSSPYAEANEVVVIIDFGKAKIEQCATRPTNLSRGGGSYIFELHVGKILPKHTVSINCHISLPVFDKILVNGKNIGQTQTFTQDQMQNRVQVIQKTANKVEIDVFGTFIGLVLFLVIICVLLSLRRLGGDMGAFMGLLASICIILLLVWLVTIIIIMGFDLV